MLLYLFFFSQSNRKTSRSYYNNLREAQEYNFRNIPEVELSDTYLPPRDENSNYYANSYLRDAEVEQEEAEEELYEEVARELSRLQRYDRRFDNYQNDYKKH